MVDVQLLLEPVVGAAPAGANLEASDAYAELERLMAGKPERQFGETLIPAEPPPWPTVVEHAAAILAVSKDLRVATHLARALLETRGYGGFADGLALVSGLLDKFWDGLHPELDEDGDATARGSAVWALTHRDVLQAVRAAPLVVSRAFGAVTLRTVDAASAQGSEGTASLEAAFADTPDDRLASAAEATARCCEAARGLEARWRAIGEGGGPDFTELVRLLTRASQLLKGRLEQRRGSSPAEEPAAAPAGFAPTPAARAPAAPGELRSREDVLRAIDGILAYYATHEPSSPVPLLLQRCKRLVTMSFLDIVKDLVPDGLSNLQAITGKQDG